MAPNFRVRLVCANCWLMEDCRKQLSDWSEQCLGPWLDFVLLCITMVTIHTLVISWLQKVGYSMCLYGTVLFEYTAVLLQHCCPPVWLSLTLQGQTAEEMISNHCSSVTPPTGGSSYSRFVIHRLRPETCSYRSKHTTDGPVCLSDVSSCDSVSITSRCAHFSTTFRGSSWGTGKSEETQRGKLWIMEKQFS